MSPYSLLPKKKVRLALDWIFTYRGQIAMNGYQSWVGQDADMRI